MPKKYFLLILIPVLVYLVYFGNIKPLLASRAANRGDIVKVLSYNTFVNYEIRIVMAKQALESDDVDFVWFAKEQMEENVKERPFDCKSYIFLFNLYYRFGETEKAKWVAQKALELAPAREDLKELLINVSGP